MNEDLNGEDVCDVSASAAMLHAAFSLYADPMGTSREGKYRAKMLIDGVLDAATKNGFKESEKLMKLLVRNDFNKKAIKKTVYMMEDAFNTAGIEAITEIFVKHFTFEFVRVK